MGIEKTKDGISNFRGRKHLSQTELAKKLKKNSQNVSKWEAGKGYPGFPVVCQLFEMGITVEELFGIDYNTIHDLVKKDLAPQASGAGSNEDVLRRLQQMENDMLQAKNDVRLARNEIEMLKKPSTMSTKVGIAEVG
jgi:transcriptional regulator with XRE-family HTH domain